MRKAVFMDYNSNDDVFVVRESGLLFDLSARFYCLRLEARDNGLLVLKLFVCDSLICLELMTNTNIDNIKTTAKQQTIGKV